MNCNGQDVINQIKEAACHRITFNYLLDVREGKLCVEKRIGVWIRIDKEKTGDQRTYPLWKRICHIPCDLSFTAHYVENGQIKTVDLYDGNQDKIKVVGDSVEFNGGYLKVVDPGLRKPFNEADIRFKDIEKSPADPGCPEFEYSPEAFITKLTISHMLKKSIESLNASPGIKGISTSDLAEHLLAPDLPEGAKLADQQIARIAHVVPPGRNIHIEVEFSEGDDKEKQPIFYFPQNSDDPDEDDLGILFLGTSSGRELHWIISNLHLNSDPFELDDGDDRHMISVSQDSNWLSKSLEEPSGRGNYPYFEMLVDSIGLGHALQWIGTLPVPISPKDDASLYMDRIADHLFGTGERTFYVGIVPEHKEEADRVLLNKKFEDVWKGETFRGSIHRLFFDPNASCGGC